MCWLVQKTRVLALGFVIGLVVTLGCMLGGFAAMGGHVAVIWQPFEFIIIFGSSLGIFIIANPFKLIKDTGEAIVEGVLEKGPKPRDYLDVLGLLHSLMRELRAKGRNEIEGHVEGPENSPLFQAYPKILHNKALTTFICDYMRLIIIGNARTHEIESLMDEELNTILSDKLKPYAALTNAGDGMPALGIVAAVLGVVKAMGALDQSPEILGELIGAALVGTFAGIFVAYGVMGPLANKVKLARQKQARIFVVVKQSLLAFMNGAMPQIAIERGRKTISASDRPSIDEVENEAVSGGSGALKEAA